MRTKKRIVIITVLVILISVVVYTVALFTGNNCYSGKMNEWIKTISSGVFASAIVAFFVSVGEYFSERRIAIEAYCEATYQLLYHFRNLDYFDSSIQTDQENFSKALQQYKKLIVAERQHSLSHCYGNLDFLFANKRIRNTIAYQRIYEREHAVRAALIELAFHIDIYDDAVRKGGIGNQPVLAYKIIEIQKMLFEEENSDNAELNYNIQKVYKTFVFEIDAAVYDLLQFLYGSNNVEPKPEKDKYFRCGRLIDIEKSEEA